MSIQELLILSFLFEIYNMKFLTLIFNFYSFSVMVIVMGYLVLHILILFNKIVYVMLKLEHYVFNPSLNLCSSSQSLVFIRKIKVRRERGMFVFYYHATYLLFLFDVCVL